MDEPHVHPVEVSHESHEGQIGDQNVAIEGHRHDQDAAVSNVSDDCSGPNGSGPGVDLPTDITEQLHFNSHRDKPELFARCFQFLDSLKNYFSENSTRIQKCYVLLQAFTDRQMDKDQVRIGIMNEIQQHEPLVQELEAIFREGERYHASMPVDRSHPSPQPTTMPTPAMLAPTTPTPMATPMFLEPRYQPHFPMPAMNAYTDHQFTPMFSINPRMLQSPPAYGQGMIMHNGYSNINLTTRGHGDHFSLREHMFPGMAYQNYTDASMSIVPSSLDMPFVDADSHLHPYAPTFIAGTPVQPHLPLGSHEVHPFLNCKNAMPVNQPSHPGYHSPRLNLRAGQPYAIDRADSKGLPQMPVAAPSRQGYVVSDGLVNDDCAASMQSSPALTNRDSVSPGPPHMTMSNFALSEQAGYVTIPSRREVDDMPPLKKPAKRHSSTFDADDGSDFEDTLRGFLGPALHSPMEGPYVERKGSLSLQTDTSPKVVQQSFLGNMRALPRSVDASCSDRTGVPRMPRFIHAICGKAFKDRSAVRRHHWGRVVDDVNTTSGCWAKHGKPDRLWHEHSSCNVGGRVEHRQRSKPTRTRITQNFVEGTGLSTSGDGLTSIEGTSSTMLGDDMATTASTNAVNFTSQIAVGGRFTQFHSHRLPGSATQGIDDLVKAVNEASNTHGMTEQDRNDSVVACCNASAADPTSQVNPSAEWDVGDGGRVFKSFSHSTSLEQDYLSGIEAHTGLSITPNHQDVGNGMDGVGAEFLSANASALKRDRPAHGSISKRELRMLDIDETSASPVKKRMRRENTFSNADQSFLPDLNATKGTSVDTPIADADKHSSAD